MKKRITRRSFIKGAATASAVAGFDIVPSFAVPPSDKVNMAFIGCAHQGGTDAQQALRHKNVNVVAMCDVVPGRTGRIAGEMKKQNRPEVKVYDDFRKMFDEKENEIDACTVAIPDHAHFPVCMLAMSLGKHIYVEKPMAQTFEECELMMTAENKYKVACQMGNQGHSDNQRRQFQQWVERGIIKDVKKIDAWMNKKRRWWGWGMVKDYPAGEALPEGMNWDVWTATRPKHPYNRKYDPGNWRSWFLYGNGAFGDWGPHILDSIHRYLKLGLPTSIRAKKLIKPVSPVVFPKGSTIAFNFPARENMPAITIDWYDGPDNQPPKPEGYKGRHGIKGKFIYCGDGVVVKGGSHHETHQVVVGNVDREKLKLTGKPETSTVHMTNFINAAMQGRVQLQVLSCRTPDPGVHARLHCPAARRRAEVRSGEKADYKQRKGQRTAEGRAAPQGMGTVLQAVTGPET